MSKKPATKAAVKPAAKAATKPATAKAAAKPAAAAKSAAAKSASKSASTKSSAKPTSKPASSAKPAGSKPAGVKPPGARVTNVGAIKNDPNSAHVILFTSCGQPGNKVVNILLVKESYEKWGIPGGGKRPDESLQDTAKREFEEETGHTFPTLELKEEFTYKNSHIILGYTKDCIEPEFGSNPAPKVRGPETAIKALKHVPCSEILKWVANPGAGFLVRQVLVDMLNETRDRVNDFCKKCSAIANK